MTNAQRWFEALIWAIKFWIIGLTILGIAMLAAVRIHNGAGIAVLAFAYTVWAHYWLKTPPKGDSK